MRRSRTPTTAWPAVADLMTFFAVVGLFAAAAVVVAPDGSPRQESIAELRAVVDSQRTVIEELQRKIAGFVPCWPGGSDGRLYYFTYDVTHRDGGYTVSRHDDFDTGIGADPRPPDRVERVFGDVPRGRIDEAALVAFGRRVTEAAREHYPAECQLAVTINPDASGDQIEPLRRGRLYPVWR